MVIIFLLNQWESFCLLYLLACLPACLVTCHSLACCSDSVAFEWMDYIHVHCHYVPNMDLLCQWNVRDFGRTWNGWTYEINEFKQKPSSHKRTNWQICYVSCSYTECMMWNGTHLPSPGEWKVICLEFLKDIDGCLFEWQLRRMKRLDELI